MRVIRHWSARRRGWYSGIAGAHVTIPRIARRSRVIFRTVAWKMSRRTVALTCFPAMSEVMRMLRIILTVLVCAATWACDSRPPGPAAVRSAVRTAGHADLLRSLIDPAKLATLGKRGANERIRRITGILHEAKQSGHDPGAVAREAVALIGWGGTAKGDLTAAAMERNVTIIGRLGSTTEEDIAAMRRGRAPTVRTGPYAGQVLTVDHIIPRAVAPELDNVIANLELMPLGLNQGKSDSVTERQTDLARKFHAAGLLSADGLQRVLSAATLSTRKAASRSSSSGSTR